jgi:hypothetical protein
MGIESIDSSRLAATGQIGGPAQPGQNQRLLACLPALNFQGPIDLASCAPLGKNVLPGILNFGNPNGFGGKFFAAIMEAAQKLSQVNSDGVAYYQQTAANTQQTSISEFVGSGLPRASRVSSNNDIEIA